MLPMMGEPPRTAYDLHFQCVGVPVRVSPMFWVMSLLLGLNGRGIDLLLFPLAVFASILVHELGHALVMRRFGETPRIVLLMMGGLAISDRPSYLPDQSHSRSTRNQILISLAGPGAGFAFAAILVAVIYAVGARIEPGLTLLADFRGLIDESQSNVRAIEVISSMMTILLRINVYWGIMNLMPVYPLDGGQVARELLTMRDPWKGVVRSLWLSIFTSVLIALAGLSYSFFLCIMFGFLAFSNYQTLQRFSGGGGRGGSFGGGYDAHGERDDRPW